MLSGRICLCVRRRSVCKCVTVIDDEELPNTLQLIHKQYRLLESKHNHRTTISKASCLSLFIHPLTAKLNY